MKRLLSLVLMATLLVSIGGVLGVGTAGLSTTGNAVAEWSSLHVTSGSQSAHLQADHITSYPPTNEGRLRIVPNPDMTLSQLNTISWQQYVQVGYISHIDVLLDLNKDGEVDDTLVFEYAKVNPSDCDNSEDYPTGEVNTFGDKGTISETSYAWLNSGPAGPCGDPSFIHGSLANWKAGSVSGGESVSGTADIIAFEIEVDGWIEGSEAYIDEVMINGAEVEIEDTSSGSQGLDSDLDDIVSISISPDTLNFGAIPRGPSIVKEAVNNPILIDGSASDTESENVYVYADVTGTDEAFYEALLELETSPGVWENIMDITYLTIPDDDSKTYNTQLHGNTIPYEAGPKQATIVYTAYGTPI
jgi:hypothetical protein